LGTIRPIIRARRLARRRDWAGAATVLEAAAARNRADARLSLELARAYEGQRRWEEAAQAYRAALSNKDRQPETFLHLGWALQRQRRWKEAAEAHRAAVNAYEAALADDASNRALRLGLGRALEGVRDLAGARRAYEDLLERDPQASEIDRRLLAADSRRFPARREYARFVIAYLDEIRERASAVIPRSSGPRVWFYWGQGLAAAPAVVRRCHDELMRQHAADEVVVLDDGLVPEYVEIPEAARRRTSEDRTKFSDVLRLELLSRYGGVWLDATCLVRRRLLDLLPELLPSGFFAFRYHTARIATWFLASEPNHPTVVMAREAQHVYWEQFRSPIDYYVLHHLIESLYHVADDFRERVDQMPWRSVEPPSRLARAMHQPYDPERHDELLGGSFVHKLTHKFPPAQAKPGTLLERI
jgi:tetratricopeptide (TPR) repeat protein